MILHDGSAVPAFEDYWDTYDKDTIWIAWDSLLRGSSISASEWVAPDNWTVHSSQMAASVTDVDGKSYTAANGALVSTTDTAGRYKISNRVTLADGRQYERTVIVVVRQL